MPCMFNIALRRRWSGLACLTLSFPNTVTHCIWKSQYPLRRFLNLPGVVVQKLEQKRNIEWPRYFDLTPPNLGELVDVLNMDWTLHLACAAVSKGGYLDVLPAN